MSQEATSTQDAHYNLVSALQGGDTISQYMADGGAIASLLSSSKTRKGNISTC